MKTFRQGIFLLLTLAFCSCSKSNNATPQSNTPVTGTVSIGGTTYPTITIGNQVWTTQNFVGAGNATLINNTGNVATYGNYYAMASISLPSGWRIPTVDDYNKLMANYSPKTFSGNNYLDMNGAKALMAKSDWQTVTGTNTSGFNALPAGYAIFLPFSVNTAYPEQTGHTAYFLTSSNITFWDNITNKNDVDTYVLALSDQGLSLPNQAGIYAAISTLTNDSNGVQLYGSLRFVKDK